MQIAITSGSSTGAKPINEAIYLASLNPAKSINIDQNKGSLEIGKDADIAIFDNNFDCYMTIVNGEIVFKQM